MDRTALFVTGATGLVGSGVLRRLLRRDPGRTAYVLVRDPTRLRAGRLGSTVVPLVGVLTRPGLGLDRHTRRELRRRVGLVVHAAADTCFSRSLSRARAVNRDGTARVLDLWDGGAELRRFVHVSTAFVAGCRTGVIREDDRPAEAWVNAYERSKTEAEALVRGSGAPWVIARPSTIACDGPSGVVTQVNAVHRALRLHHAGLASILPGREDSPVDLIPADHVWGGVASLVLEPGVEGETVHLCAGDGALALGELLERAHAAWAEVEGWRRRGVSRPVLTDLDTYRLFEQSVEETGDPRLRRITRSFAHFVPQLALPKRFDTTRADALPGGPAPPVASYWDRILRDLRDRLWAGASHPVPRTA
jgi:long-chain acyl-CoA synthetase